MSATVYDFMSGDTLSVLRVNIVDSVGRQPVPLSTLFTASLVWSIDGGPSVSRAMNVLSGADDGAVEYQFTTGELVAGSMVAQVKLTQISSGNIVTTVNPIKKTIGASL